MKSGTTITRDDDDDDDRREERNHEGDEREKRREKKTRVSERHSMMERKMRFLVEIGFLGEVDKKVHFRRQMGQRREQQAQAWISLWRYLSEGKVPIMCYV